MDAGRELDALVAEKVMGGASWDYVIEGTSRCGREFASVAEAKAHRATSKYVVGPVVLHDSIPYYSTDIAAAWEVVDALSSRGFYVCVEHVHLPAPRPSWNAWVGKHNQGADTAPLAICLAALRSPEGK